MTVWEDYEKQCKIEMTGRGLMIPFFLAGFAIVVISVQQMIGCRKKNEQLKNLDEMEMGKFNAV